MIDYLIFFAFRSLRFFSRLLPLRALRAFAFLLARFSYYADRKHTKIIHKNLAFFLGGVRDEKERKKIAKAVYYRFAIYLFDVLRSRGYDKNVLTSIVKVENEQAILNAINGGEKIILLTGHYGYWELVAQYICAVYRPFVTIGQKLQNSPKLTEELKKYRERSGLETIDKKGAMRSIARALKEGKIAGFLSDQSTKEGVKVKFFDRDLTWIDSASRLARQFGAIVVPCFITTDDFKSYTLFFSDPLRPDPNEEKERDIERMAALEALSLQRAIERNPEEYFWFHKRMKREIESFYD
jgi:KDO2-lipid IV(A) lauroyltransferase